MGLQRQKVCDAKIIRYATCAKEYVTFKEELSDALYTDDHCALSLHRHIQGPVCIVAWHQVALCAALLNNYTMALRILWLWSLCWEKNARCTWDLAMQHTAVVPRACQPLCGAWWPRANRCLQVTVPRRIAKTIITHEKLENSSLPLNGQCRKAEYMTVKTDHLYEAYHWRQESMTWKSKCSDLELSTDWFAPFLFFQKLYSQCKHMEVDDSLYMG